MPTERRMSMIVELFFVKKNVILNTWNNAFFKSLRRLVTIDYFDKQLKGMHHSKFPFMEQV